METSSNKKTTGLIIAVVVLSVIVVLAFGMHYARTGRIFPTMYEMQRDATAAGDRMNQNTMDNRNAQIDRDLANRGFVDNNGIVDYNADMTTPYADTYPNTTTPAAPYQPNTGVLH